MNPYNEILSKKDLELLSKNPSVDNKRKAVRKVADYYKGKIISEKELKLTEDIFRVVVKDIEIEVRRILAESLQNAKNIPQDIVKKLVNDENSVAVPFIKYYGDLTNQDLIDIIEFQNPEKQKAVAGRKNLSEDISDYIAAKCSEDVINVLVSNETARIIEPTFNKIVDRYPESKKINKSLVYRSKLPVPIVERIVNSLSEDLQERLVTHHDLPNNLVADIVEQVKEKAILKISEDYNSDKKIKELVEQLYNSERLSHSLMVRSICMGDLRFFEYALFYITKLPIVEIRKVLFNIEADFVIRNLLRKALIPQNMFPAVFSALKTIKDIKFDCRKNNPHSFSHKVIERILSVESSGEELSAEDIDYLISKIS